MASRVYREYTLSTGLGLRPQAILLITSGIFPVHPQKSWVNIYIPVTHILPKGAETHGSVQLSLVLYQYNSELYNITVQPSLSVDIILSHRLPSDEVVKFFQLSIMHIDLL